MGATSGEKIGAANAVPEQGEGFIRQVLTIELHQVSVQAIQQTVLVAVALSVLLSGTVRRKVFVLTFCAMVVIFFYFSD